MIKTLEHMLMSSLSEWIVVSNKLYNSSWLEKYQKRWNSIAGRESVERDELTN